MSKNPVKSPKRRQFFRFGIGALGALATHSALASACKIPTGSQPQGPFFPTDDSLAIDTLEDAGSATPAFLANDNDLTFIRGKSGVATGQIVEIRGQVLDAQCEPVPQANIIAWQASSSGRYNHLGDSANSDFTHPKSGAVIKRVLDPYFQYWGKATTDNQGHYSFRTVVPGFYPADLRNGWYRPPHIHFMVSATGKESFVTQMYFRGEAIKDNDWIQELNQKDLLLESPNLTADQRQKLIVAFAKTNEDQLLGQFDILLPS